VGSRVLTVRLRAVLAEDRGCMMLPGSGSCSPTARAKPTRAKAASLTARRANRHTRAQRVGDLRTEPQEAGIGQVRYLAIERATANPLAPTWEEPEGFNRHGTLHGKPEYYGEAETLAGLLLLVAWVRELSWWAENDPGVFPE
jgi:hypothetical protein